MGGYLILRNYCFYDENFDERMMMNGCNVVVDKLKLKERSLGF